MKCGAVGVSGEEGGTAQVEMGEGAQAEGPQRGVTVRLRGEEVEKTCSIVQELGGDRGEIPPVTDTGDLAFRPDIRAFSVGHSPQCWR